MNVRFDHAIEPANDHEKILLVLLPLWDRMIPPLGISCLKDFLKQNGYQVKTADANIEKEFKEIADEYFETLRKQIPPHKQANFIYIGFDVIQHHLMAHQKHVDERPYHELVKIIIQRTFFTEMSDNVIRKLHAILDRFYAALETYVSRLLERERPDVLGLSVYSSTLPASLFAFQLAKSKYPHIKTVMGGGTFTNQLAVGSPNLVYLEEITKGYIDKILVGEGELLFLKYLKGELPEDKRLITAEDIRNERLDLEKTGFPDFSDLDQNYYNSLSLYGSRSCPMQCSFCAETVFWGAYRKKTAFKIVQEMKALYDRHRRQIFMFGDSLLNPFIAELSAQLAEEDLSFYWDGYLRADKHTCRTDNTFSWRRSGFYRARLGLESGSPRILEMMQKKITPTQIREAVMSLAYAGIKTTTYWIAGYPGETDDDFQQTLDLIEELKDFIYEADCNPFWYYPTGQSNSGQWERSHPTRLLYPAWAKDLLVTQVWILDCEPGREEIYNRLNRFILHCKKLDIPNPYSVYDIHQADKRWKKLQKNAVPSLLEFEDIPGTVISEHKRISEVLKIQHSEPEKGDFSF